MSGLSAAGSAAITSVAITDSAAPSRSAAIRPARWCAWTPAHAAANGSIPRASSAPIVPDSTSPVPAVASPGLPPALIASRSPSTTSVSSPFSTTIAPLRSAASRAQASRCSATSRDSRPSSRPSSPACGVSTVGAARSAIESRRSAWAFSPSASIRSGASIRCASARASSSESSSRPSPGPRTTAAARSAASRIASAERAARRPSAPREAARHHLGQLHLEDRLEVGRHGDRRVARAGADRGLGGHADGAGQAARAADHQHLAGVELGRVRRPRGREVEHAVPDHARRGLGGGAGGNPDLGDPKLAGVRLARRDPVAELGGVEADRDVRLDRDPCDLAGRGVDARRRCRRRRPAPRSR